MRLTVTGTIIEWRGPAPFYFLPLSEDQSDAVYEVRLAVQYWGVIPVTCTLGDTTFTTSMIPREGRYLVPLKDAVRKPARLTAGDTATLTVLIDI